MPVVAGRSGASAGVVGTIVWPSALAIAKPAPSLPLFGSDWPPVASTTARATMPPRGRRRAESLRRPRSIVEHARGRTQRRRRQRSAARKQRVEHVARAVASRETACRRPPRAAGRRSRGRRRSFRRPESARSTRRTIVGRPPQKSRSVTIGVGDVAARAAADEDLGARLLRAFEQRRRTAQDSVARVKMAVARPAAPAPTIATSQDGGRFSPPTRYYAAAGFVETTVECVPHALQRMISVFPSSRRPMIWVR